MVAVRIEESTKKITAKNWSAIQKDFSQAVKTWKKLILKRQSIIWGDIIIVPNSQVLKSSQEKYALLILLRYLFR